MMNREEIEALVEMKRNCLNASVYDDEKRLIKANAITRALMLQERIDKAIEYNNYLKEHCSYKLNKGHLRKMGKILKGDSNE